MTVDETRGTISMINHTYLTNMKNTKHSFPEGSIFGSATLGERGQLVVPKEARTRLGLKEGERFLVIEHMGKIILVPEVQVRHIVKEVTKHLEK